MNFISNLTCGQIFGVIIGGFMILVILEWFRRETISRPWPKVAIRWIFRLIGYGILFRGLSELRLGRWIGVGWVLVGAGVTSLTSRGRIEKLIQKRAEKDQRRE